MYSALLHICGTNLTVFSQCTAPSCAKRPVPLPATWGTSRAPQGRPHRQAQASACTWKSLRETPTPRLPSTMYKIYMYTGIPSVCTSVYIS